MSKLLTDGGANIARGCMDIDVFAEDREERTRLLREALSILMEIEGTGTVAEAFRLDKLLAEIQEAVKE